MRSSICSLLLIRFAVLIFGPLKNVVQTEDITKSSRNEGGYMTVFVCDGDYLNISCGSGQKLHLIRANYGRLSVDICSSVKSPSTSSPIDIEGRNIGYSERSGWSVHCLWPRTLRHLQRRCGRGSGCLLPVTSNQLQDMCPGTPKYLEVHYNCVSVVGTRSTTGRPVPPWLSSSTPESLHSSHNRPIHPPSPPPVFTSLSSAILATTMRANIAVPQRYHGNKSGTISDRATIVTASWNDYPQSPDLSGKEGHNNTPSEEITASSSVTHSPGEKTPAQTEDSFHHSYLSAGENLQEEQRVSSEALSGYGQQTRESSDEDAVFVLGKPSGADISDRLVNENIAHSETHNAPAETAQCPSVASRGLRWNRTAAGEAAMQLCPAGSSGVARRTCDGERSHWMPADLSQCRSNVLAGLHRDLMSGASVAAISNNLERIFLGRPSRHLYGGDITLILRLINQLCSRLSQQLVASAGAEQRPGEAAHLSSTGVAEQFAVRAASVIDWLISGSSDSDAAWLDLSFNTDSVHSFTELLICLENVAFSVIDHSVQDSMLLANKSNLVMVTKRPRVNSHCSIGSQLYRASYAGANICAAEFQIACASLLPHKRSGRVNLVSFWMPSIGEKLSQINSTMPSLASGVLGVSLGVGRHTVLLSPVRLFLPHLSSQSPRPVVYRCVFWDVLVGDWSSRGCRRVDSNRSHTICECDHLAGFSLQIDADHDITVNSNNNSGSNVTSAGDSATSDTAGSVLHSSSAAANLLYGGQLVSVGLLLCALFHTQNVYGERRWMRRHLVAGLLAVNIGIIAGTALVRHNGALVRHSAACTAISVQLHYCLLVVAAWILYDAAQLHAGATSTVNNSMKRVPGAVHPRYWLLAYVLPLLVVVSCYLLQPSGYGLTDTHCWISSEHYFLLSFAIPTAVVFVMTLCLHAISWLLLSKHARAVHVSASSLCVVRLSAERRWLRFSLLMTVIGVALFCLLPVAFHWALWLPVQCVFALCSVLMSTSVLLQHRYGPLGQEEISSLTRSLAVCETASTGTHNTSIYGSQRKKMAGCASPCADLYQTAVSDNTSAYFTVHTSDEKSPHKPNIAQDYRSYGRSERAVYSGVPLGADKLYVDEDATQYSCPAFPLAATDRISRPSAVYDKLSCRVYGERAVCGVKSADHGDKARSVVTALPVDSPSTARASYSTAMPICGTRVYSSKRPRRFQPASQCNTIDASLRSSTGVYNRSDRPNLPCMSAQSTEHHYSRVDFPCSRTHNAYSRNGGLRDNKQYDSAVKVHR